MKNFPKRAICAALALTLTPGMAAAATYPAAPQANSYSAIATGMSIPTPGRGFAAPVTNNRSVLVDAASATLFMMEGGRIVDSMKVIVGKPSAATPELRTTLTYATLNPYWHVPTDLARTLTAPNVLKHGVSYLEERGYEVLSRFGPNAEVIDPRSVDWQAVADGRAVAYVRQRPGPANSMGQMKFSMASGGEIFLHDTPRKELFAQDDRSLSAGCVRLEDAPRLARWLLGGEAPLAASVPEKQLPLPRQVPITIAYLDNSARMQLASLR